MGQQNHNLAVRYNTIGEDYAVLTLGRGYVGVLKVGNVYFVDFKNSQPEEQNNSQTYALENIAADASYEATNFKPTPKKPAYDSPSKNLETTTLYLVSAPNTEPKKESGLELAVNGQKIERGDSNVIDLSKYQQPYGKYNPENNIATRLYKETSLWTQEPPMDEKMPETTHSNTAGLANISIVKKAGTSGDAVVSNRPSWGCVKMDSVISQ